MYESQLTQHRCLERTVNVVGSLRIRFGNGRNEIEANSSERCRIGGVGHKSKVTISSFSVGFRCVNRLEESAAFGVQIKLRMVMFRSAWQHAVFIESQHASPRMHSHYLK